MRRLAHGLTLFSRRMALAAALPIVLVACSSAQSPPEPTGVTSQALLGAPYELDGPVPGSPEAYGQSLVGFAADTQRGLAIVDDAPDRDHGLERYVAIPVDGDAQELAPPRTIDPVALIGFDGDGFVGIVPKASELTARFIDRNGARVEDVPISNSWLGYDPATLPYEQPYESVACDATGNCIVLWMRSRDGALGYALHVAPLRHGGAYPASTVVANAYWAEGIALGGSAGLAAVSLSGDSHGNPGLLSFQRFDASGSPDGAPVVLADNVLGQELSVSAVAVADGYVVGWESVDPTKNAIKYHLVHLDFAGSGQGPALVLPADVEAAATSGQAVLGPWRDGVLLYTGKANPYRVSLDGQVTQLATDVPSQHLAWTRVAAATGVQVLPQGKLVVAWDDAAMMGNAGDVYAQALDPDTGLIGKPDLLTRADNSMSSVITRAQSSLLGFFYTDDGTGGNGLYDVPLGPSGCPTESGRLQYSFPPAQQTRWGGLVSDGRSTLFVDVGDQKVNAAMRFGPDGKQLSPPLALPGTRQGQVLPLPGAGGYWIYESNDSSLGSLFRVGTDGSITSLSPPDVRPLVANAERDQLLGIRYHYQGDYCAVSLDEVLFNSNGKQLYQPRQIFALDPTTNDCFAVSKAITDGAGYVLLITTDSGSQTLVRLDGNGTPPVEKMPLPPELANVLQFARTADGFVWLTRANQGDVVVVRTDEHFAVTGTDTIAGDGVVRARLAPALDPKFVLVDKERVWPASVRTEVYRLDGGSCTTPPHVDGGIAGAGGAAGAAGTAGTAATAGAAGAGGAAGAAGSGNVPGNQDIAGYASGCACRAVPTRNPAWAVLAMLTALLGLCWRRRTTGLGS